MLNDASSSFNSTLVRLKLTYARRQLTGRSRFQFHTGSIKAARRLQRGCIRDDLFQFHTGSIKASEAPAPELRRQIHEFQFHTGSIKADAQVGSVERA